jgi:signal transduction histidine kinase
MGSGIRNLRISIRTRLIAAFLAVVILPVGITVGFYIFENYRVMKIPGVDFPKQASTIAADVAKYYTKQGSLTGVDPLLRKYKDKMTDRIQVIDFNGRVIADTAPGREPGAKGYTVAQVAELLTLPADDMEANKFGMVKNTNFEMHVGAPVKVNGRTVGLVLTTFKYADIWALVLGMMKRTLFVGIGAIIAISLFFAWLMSRDITHPLRQLVNATRSIGEGNLDARVRITARNELGELGDAFNTMVEELKQSLAREKDLENSRRELIANVSHDLRTPLTSIRGYVEGLRDGVARDPEKIKRYLDVIYEKTLGLDRLIADLFQLAQLDAGQLEMKPERVESTRLLRHIAERFQPDMEAAGISMITEIPAGLPPVTVDHERIEQALGNIIENAVKYTPAGGTISLMAIAQQQGIRVMVADTGEGISPEDLPRVFERLYRGEKSRSRQLGGTGLGLAIAKQIIEAHGGRIWVESEKGQGSRFYMRLL